MIDLKNKMEKELLEDIVPFWLKYAVDYENGGFFGKISNDLTVDKNAPKGGVLNSRILWCFSSAYRIYGKPEYLVAADSAYRYIMNHLWDKEYGGIYWLVDNRGNLLDSRKQIYAQAFAIYAFSEYYRATGINTSLDSAVELFGLLEKNSYDQEFKGYFEACNRNWRLEDFHLDQKCGQEKKSMNTMLHVMEACTNLYRVWKDERLKAKLKETIEVITEHIIDQKTGHFKLFFDDEWNSLKNECSYGHDIEGSWLLFEAAEVLGDQELIDRVKPVVLKMAEITLSEGIDHEGAVMYEGELHGVKDSDRHWWPQAEAVVGFVNAYELSGRKEFAAAAERVWNFIDEKIIDHVHGEWFWGVSRSGIIIKPDAKVDIWKCPYHNSRACMEIVERMGRRSK